MRLDKRTKSPFTSLETNLFRGGMHAHGGFPDPGLLATSLPRTAEPWPTARTLRTQLCALEDSAPHIPAWEALATHAIEPNIFAEPAFALNAARNLARGDGAVAVLVWEDAEPRRLVGLFPIWPRRLSPSVAGWRPLHAGLGTPLVDRDCPEAVIEAYLGATAARRPFGGAALFPIINEAGPFADALKRVAARTGRMVWRFDTHQRAVLWGRNAASANGEAASTKKLKELRRQSRRLGDIGAVRFESARDAKAVCRSVEVFLALEASGWKHKSGTALLQDAGVTALVRSFARDLARQGRCRVDTLWAADTPVASTIVIESGERAWFWKIAYDEAFARYSPGVQITLSLTESQLANPSIAMTDSGAIANHPMIDRLWRDRMPIADFLIATRPGPSLAADLTGSAEAVRRKIRAFAKTAYRRIRRGRSS